MEVIKRLVCILVIYFCSMSPILAHQTTTKDSEECLAIHDKIIESEKHLKLLSTSLQNGNDVVVMMTMKYRVVTAKYNIAHTEFTDCIDFNNTDFRVCNILRTLSDEKEAIHDEQLDELIKIQSDYGVKLELYNDALSNHRDLRLAHDRECNAENMNDADMDN